MPTTNQLVSIVATFYNLEDCVDYCVASLLAQTYAPCELVLVDDGSSDGTAKALMAYADRDNVKVVVTPNQGPSGARNTGVQEATGDLITFVDGDDFLHSRAVQELVTAYEQSGAGFVISRPSVQVEPDRYDDSVFSDAVSGFEVRDLKTMAADVCYDRVPLASWGCLATKDLYLDNPFPLGIGYEDIYLNARLLVQYENIAVLKGSFYGYVMRGGSVTNRRHAKIKQARDYVIAIDQFCADIRAAVPDMDYPLAYMQVLNLARLHKLCRVVEDDPVSAQEADDQALALINDLMFFVRHDKNAPLAQRIRFELLLRSPRLYDRLFGTLKRVATGI